MKGRIIYSCLFFSLFMAGLSTLSFSQTISNVTFPISSACAGTSTGLLVSYTTSTSFAAGNVFTAYLSDATGTTYTTVIGSVTSRTATPINATIPSSAVIGSGYRIQVRASSGTFANSGATLTLSQPLAPGVTTPFTYCEGALADQLTASKSAGGTLNWYAANQTTGATSTQAPTPSTTAAAIGNTIYYVSQTISGCESPKASITVTVRNKLNAPTAKSPQTICQGESPKSLTATLSDGGTQLKWYTASSGGTPLAAAPQPSITSTYYVSQSNSTDCESDRTTVVFQVIDLPSAPTVKNLSYCQGVTTDPLSATPTGTNSLLWWGTSASGGSSTTTAPSPNNQSSATYYVSQVDNNGCQSATRSPISVSIVATPTEPTVQAPPAVCAGSPVGSLTATVTSSDYELRWWGTSASGGSSTTTAPTVSNTQTATYYVSQVDKVGGCSSARKGITVTINSLPAIPTVSSPVIYCQGKPTRPLQASASNGATLNWYGTIDKDKGGSASAQAPSPPTDQAKTSLYYVSQTSDKGCESENRAVITVTVNKTPDRPSFTTPRVYCEGETADLLAATTTGTLNWYGTDSTSSPSTSATRPQTGASFVGTQNYYVSQTVSGCTSSIQTIPVQVKDTPNAPSTSSIDFCQGTGAPALSATLVANATANWYGTNSSGGLASPTAPVPANNNVGTTVYYVSQTVSGCESPRATLNVRVKATPGAPGVNSPSFCNRSQTQQLTATGAGLKWYDASDNLLNGGAPTPSSDAVGSQTFKVSQTIESCEGPKATITVTIKPIPDKPGVSNPVYCQAQQDQPQQNITSLAANVTGLGFKWYTPSGSLLSSAPIPSINQSGTQKYLVSQTINECESDKAEIQATILTPSAPATPKSLVTYCINDKAVPLEATGETGSQLRWVDPYGNVTNNAPTPSTLNTNVQLQGDPFYVYQIASYGCYSARSTIRVVVNTTPTLSLFAPTTTVNLGQRTPLQLKFTGSGPYSYSLTGGYSGTARSDTTISVLPRGNTSYLVTSVVNGCGTGLPGNTATVSVRVPTVSTSNLNATTLCAGTSLSVPFTTTGEFNPGNAFRIEVVSLADTTKKYAASTSANNSPVTTLLPTTLPGGQYYVRVKADNPEIGITGSNSPTILTIRSLPTATLSGTQNIYEGIPANLTLTFGGDGPWNVIYADSLRSYPLTVTSSPYVVEARPARTTTYRLTSVSNSCGNGTLSGTAVVSVLPLLGVDDNSLDPLVKAYPVPTETILILELNLPLTRDPAIVTLTDLTGKPVLQQATRNQRNELNLVSQPSGVYFMRIQVGDRQTVRKIMKQ
ncbi:Ig-like domain-containing protein [Spirosoma radiotolerans]|uniref:Ig-like domain-containing protein n=1 Tax=Spirosoma radiotolerans TaxID=1379870 RepID=A0A0E3ZZ52_9BACT|nr:T9SS type A sorting domain-containing protein [Spirosoma radiotolerans]AKD57844.1 hypothetical protein SD10_26025 [Spirosoma radiotolerans]